MGGWGKGGVGVVSEVEQTLEQQKTPPTSENLTETASCPQRCDNLKLNFYFSFPPFSSENSFPEFSIRSSSLENICSSHGGQQEDEQ